MTFYVPDNQAHLKSVNFLNGRCVYALNLVVITDQELILSGRKICQNVFLGR